MAPSFPRQNQAAVLRDTGPRRGGLRLRGYHPLRRGFPAHFGFPASGGPGPTTPHLPRVFPVGFGLGSPPFGRPYSGDPCWFLFLPLLRCFRSGGSRSGDIPRSTRACSARVGSPIRESRVLRLPAPTPGFSQLATPFFGARPEPSTGRLAGAVAGLG